MASCAFGAQAFFGVLFGPLKPDPCSHAPPLLYPPPPPLLPAPCLADALIIPSRWDPPPPIVPPGFWVRREGPTVCCVLVSFHKLRSHPHSEWGIVLSWFWAIGSFLFLMTQKGAIIVMECIIHKLRSHLPSRVGIISSWL